jgi:kinase suppressor of Ras 2
MRRLSTEGSEYSSRCPSGQASPNLQSPTRFHMLKSDNQKSPNLSTDHRWSNTFKVVSFSCGYCQKQMLIGVKCKNCKFRCHKECEKSAHKFARSIA